MIPELQIFLILCCFAAVAFFSATEAGVLSISHARLIHLVRAGMKSAVLLNGYLADMQRFMGAVLVGTNLTNVILSTLSASLAQTCLPNSRTLQSVWAVTMACILLFFCEYLPKLFFTTRPLRRTLMIIRLFYFVEKAISPLTALVLWLTKWLTPQKAGAQGQRFLMTREYIQHVVSDARNGARISAFERLMINRVLTLQSMKAEQVMTPLARVTKTVEDAPLEECYRLVRESGHVRLPVFSADGSRCVGVLNVLSLLAQAPDPKRTLARDGMHPPYFVRADECADNVLPLMRAYRQPMVLVRATQDNAVLGIITEENVLSALTGSL
ncbi:MAG TPA: CNNM domain-containing protein [Kiritimatiellia bacterium]|jgi:CBS domain containing-hemolysin-like protein|nr:CNNM domain-containing protein [Kiritimatiellia bacterium]HOR97228.1 CNNM domain-containing protein [Kiritimatiellia bacterium]HPC49004.1 CNNM domain-containing protein [Kiritimatiellia bacterium]HPK37136.1 CNNM domain-containing protein [Kiritimatiellia bacterium]HPW74977.1 CNNM domain-containing protein [Kiritimatiellia bacterium]